MAGEKLRLTPEELYYLGGLLNAKYIDYSYITSMNNIGRDIKLFKKEKSAALVKKGIIDEDFSGDIEIKKEYAEVLKPIFFGTMETTLDVCSIGEEVSIEMYKFHFFDGRITEVYGHEGVFTIRQISACDIEKLSLGFTNESYCEETRRALEDIDKEKVSRYIVAKYIDVGKNSGVETFLEIEGLFYNETNDGLLQILSAKDLTDCIYQTIKGV